MAVVSHHREKLDWRNPPESPRSMRKAHLVGACGSGMKALAEVLLDRGWLVSGSDTTANSPIGMELREKGVALRVGHSTAGLTEELDLLVYSPAVPLENLERRWATRHNIPQLSYPEMLGELMRQKCGVSIAGTHGKSTTTALTGWILQAAGLSPTVFVGAELRDRQANGWSGAGSQVVVESCEYRRHFLSLQPHLAAILGIEADHFDCYASLEETAAAFHDFCLLLPQNGLLVVPADSQVTLDATAECAARREIFGIECAADWQAQNLRATTRGTCFEIYYQGRLFLDAELPIPGRHMVGNAVAAVALCHEAGATAEGIKQGLESFPGLKRRFEITGNWGEITLVDDYAHHPSAIEATLRTAREQFGDRRLICVFQPHQVSRTLGLFDEFSRAFTQADQVWLVPVYGARESFAAELTEVSRELTSLILQQGVEAHFSESLDQSLASLDDAVRPGDVLMTLGAGDIDRLNHALTCRLSRNHTTR